MGKIGSSIGSFFGKSTGASNAHTAAAYKEFTPTMINSLALQKNIANQAGQQKDQNVNSFNAAISGQTGISPTMSSYLMGNNLAAANQQASQQATNAGANLDFQTQVANQQSAFQAHQMNSSNYNAAMGLNQNSSESAANRGNNLLSGLIQGGAAMAVLSDENTKENKKKLNPSDDDNSVNEFLDSLTPYNYSYKADSEGYDGGKQHLGVMAQNIERTDAGDGIVSENENGNKQLDVAQLTGSLAAGLGAIHRRLKELEGSKPMKSEAKNGRTK